MQSRLTTRTAGIVALTVSLVVGMTTNLLFLAAFQSRLDWFREPTQVLGAGATSAELLRWASVLDLIGYYLLPQSWPTCCGSGCDPAIA